MNNTTHKQQRSELKQELRDLYAAATEPRAPNISLSQPFPVSREHFAKIKLTINEQIANGVYGMPPNRHAVIAAGAINNCVQRDCEDIANAVRVARGSLGTAGLILNTPPTTPPSGDCQPCAGDVPEIADHKKHADILRRAADIISERGWCQGKFARGYGGKEIDWMSPHACSFCAVGAIYRAICDYSFMDSANGGVYADKVSQTLYRHLGGAGITVAEWNDDKGQTAENVVSKMRECADNIDTPGGECVACAGETQTRTEEEHGDFYLAQNNASELRREIENICKQAVQECADAERAAQQRKPQKYNGHIARVEKHMLDLKRRANARRIDWKGRARRRAERNPVVSTPSGNCQPCAGDVCEEFVSDAVTFTKRDDGRISVTYENRYYGDIEEPALENNPVPNSKFLFYQGLGYGHWRLKAAAQTYDGIKECVFKLLELESRPWHEHLMRPSGESVPCAGDVKHDITIPVGEEIGNGGLEDEHYQLYVHAIHEYDEGHPAHEAADALANLEIIPCPNGVNHKWGGTCSDFELLKVAGEISPANKHPEVVRMREV